MSQSIRPATGGVIIGGTTPVVVTDRQRRINEHTLRDLERAHAELKSSIEHISNYPNIISILQT